MASSDRGAYIRFKPQRFDGDEPFSSFGGDVLGNVNHLADQFSQVRVAWVARQAAHYFEPEVGAASIEAGIFYRCWQSCPFDLHVRETGESYGLRIRVRGARSAGTGTVNFRVVVASETHGSAYVNGIDLFPNLAGATTSSATHAWMDARPGGATVGGVVANLASDQVLQAARSAASTDELGGTVVDGRWLRCTAEVWASTTDVASVPRVSGLHVAEYYAP